MGNGQGLKDQWGVTDPAKAGSDKQAQEFQGCFQKEISAISGDLQYTSANAEAARHDPLAARRDALYPAFQAALGQIDRTNPAKAKGAIDKVLADAKALNTEVSKFRKEAEKARNDWQARQPKFDAAVQQIEELESWGDPKANPLRGLVDGVRKETDKKRYAPASATLDQLLPKLQPIYDNYVKQKAAKEQYEPLEATLKSRLGNASQSRFEKLAPMQQDISAIQTQMETAAQSKEYVKALASVNDLSTKVDAFEAALAELEQQKKDYEAALAALQPRLPTSSQTKYAKLAPMEAEIVALQGQMEAAAAAGDYDEALKLATDLGAKLDAYEAAVAEIEAKKKEYEDALAALQPRLPTSSQTKYAKLAPMEAEIVALQGQMEAAAAAGDYDEALKLATDLGAKLDAYEAAVAEIEAKKKEYEDALAALQPRLPTSSQTKYAKLAPMEAEIVALQGQMEAAAAAGDYDEALKLATDLGAKLDAYEAAVAEIDQKKEAYETALAALQPRLDAVSVSNPDYASIEPLLQDITQARTTLEATAQAGDYDQASTQVQDLSTKLDAYEQAKAKIDEQKQAYETALAALQPKLPTTCPVNPKLSALDAEITTLKGQMEAAATSKDYAKALELANQVSAKADEFQKTLAEFEKNKQEYEAALKALQPKLPTTCPVNASLAERHAEIMALKGQMEAAASSQDYAKALELAKQLTTKLDAYQKAVKETPPSPEKVKEVQDLITSGKKEEALQKAMEVYGVDKSQAKKIVYDASVSGEAETSRDGTIAVGDKSFSSPGWLASSAAHEAEVHVNKQAKAGKWYTGTMGTAIQEVQAYDHEIANAHKYDLTEAEIKDLKKRRKAYYDQLNGDYKKQADEGNYDMKPGEEGL